MPSNRIINVPLISFAGCAAVYVLYKLFQYYNRRQRILSKEELAKVAWKPVGVVKKIWLYPVKSCAPLDLSEAEAMPRGFVTTKHNVRDRSFIIVLSKSPHTMVTGRMCPKTVLITPRIMEEGSLMLSFPDTSDHVVTERDWMDGNEITTKVFSDEVKGKDCGAGVGDWLSSILHREVKLLYCHEEIQVNRKAKSGLKGHFPLLKPLQDAPLYADGNSYLLMSQESVQDLDQRCSKIITAKRLRPNIVVESCNKGVVCEPLKPFAEDSWGYIKFGPRAIMRNVYPCSRCVFTCVDPVTGTFDKAPHTLTELKKYRSKKYGEPIFGVNLGLETEGTVKVGNIVYVAQL